MSHSVEISRYKFTSPSLVENSNSNSCSINPRCMREWRPFVYTMNVFFSAACMRAVTSIDRLVVRGRRNPRDSHSSLGAPVDPAAGARHLPHHHPSRIRIAWSTAIWILTKKSPSSCVMRHHKLTVVYAADNPHSESLWLMPSKMT